MKALDCPQCGGLLPKQARWRSVTCPYCAANITLAANVVHVAEFHAAMQRSQARAWYAAQGYPILSIARQSYQVLAQLGRGSSNSVFLAQRISPLPERVVIKQAADRVQPEQEASILQRLQQEANVLQRLQTNQHSSNLWFSQCWPQVVALGTNQYGSPALILRHPSGFWGSLDQVRANYPQGIDPRHSVWMWRRVLELLAFLHETGWTHGAISPAHLLVHPRDHGIRLISWRTAQFSDKPDPAAQAQDLMQSASAILSLLPDTAPAMLRDFLQRTQNSAAFCQQHGARGIEQNLKDIARAAFGPSRFVHFNPSPTTL